MNDYFEHKKFKNFELKQFVKAYAKATEDANTISTITDIDGLIIYADKQFFEISQYSSDELIGKKNMIISNNNHSAAFFKEMWDTISAGIAWKGNIKNKTKDGTEFWLDTKILPIKNSKGVVQKYFSISKLNNNQKKIEGDRAKNLLELEKILHLISHDFRRPITNLLSIANLYTKIPPDSLEAIYLLNYIKQNSLELDEYTRNLSEHIYQLSLDENMMDEL